MRDRAVQRLAHDDRVAEAQVWGELRAVREEGCFEAVLVGDKVGPRIEEPEEGVLLLRLL